MKLFRYILESFLLGFFLLLAKLLPVQWASGLGGFLGRIIGPKLGASKKAFNNLKMIMPDLTDAEAQNIITGMWDNLGRVMMEYPHLKHIGRERTEIIGAEILEQYRDKATILFAAHLANWEVCPPAMLLQHNFDSMPIYRAPNNPFSDALLKWARSVNGKLKTIPKSKSGTRNIVKALQDGERIGVLIDQKYNEGVAADFLGKPAMTSPAFVQLAQKFNTPLVPLRIERLKGPNFRITILPPVNIENKPMETVLDECHDILGNWITEKPEQWLWLHRRWNSKQLKD